MFKKTIMDHISYHGTNKENAKDIVELPSKLNIEIGKGELGKGFYTGSSIALAAIWANNRYPHDGAVIQFNISATNFVKLKGHILKTRSNVINNWSELKKSNQNSFYTFGYDYIIAPFATIEDIGTQYKFESKAAENELKSCKKFVYLCGS